MAKYAMAIQSGNPMCCSPCELPQNRNAGGAGEWMVGEVRSRVVVCA